MAYGFSPGNRQSAAHADRRAASVVTRTSADLTHVTSHRSGAEGGRIDDLICRMRHGDREAAAAFITKYGSRLRRRIRGKLGPAMRRLFDSQEILSTVSRRLDMYVRDGRMQASHERQLWSLIFKIADNALIDKIRVFEHLQRIEGSDAPFARDILHRLERAEQQNADGNAGAEIEIEQAMNALPDHTDRTILSMWLMGHPHESIAEALDMASTGVRKRWQSIKKKLRTRFCSGMEHSRHAG